MNLQQAFILKTQKSLLPHLEAWLKRAILYLLLSTRSNLLGLRTGLLILDRGVVVKAEKVVSWNHAKLGGTY